MSKIYTKTGDKGKTSLFNGTRVSKNNSRVNAYGTVDELNSVIGVILAEIYDLRFKIQEVEEELITIQNDLLTIGSVLANPDETGRLDVAYLQERVEKFESLIDTMTEQMPLLTHFILPGGGKVGSLLHLARTVARRAERMIVGLSEETEVPQEIVIYFNRFSDLLFTMARFSNFVEKKKETIWNG